MSVRPTSEHTVVVQRPVVLSDIEAQRQAEVSATQAEEAENLIINAVGPLDTLNETERSAAQLGVSAEEWKPISFMNKQHYGQLLRGNALAGNLAQKLEAYKEVANGTSPVLSQ